MTTAICSIQLSASRRCGTSMPSTDARERIVRRRGRWYANGANYDGDMPVSPIPSSQVVGTDLVMFAIDEPVNVAPREFLDAIAALEPGVWGIPCSIELTDGRAFDLALAWENRRFGDAGEWVNPQRIARVSASLKRMPARLARLIHNAGESGMGYHIYVVQLRDGIAWFTWRGIWLLIWSTFRWVIRAKTLSAFVHMKVENVRARRATVTSTSSRPWNTPGQPAVPSKQPFQTNRLSGTALGKLQGRRCRAGD